MKDKAHHSAARESCLSNSSQAKAPKPYGTVYYVSGEQYTGEWQGAKRHGQGVVTYKNGDKYGGDWADGRRHGNGTLWVLQGGRYNVRYSGDWRHDLPEGSGVLYDDEGGSYEGEFLGGLRHGRGRAVMGGGSSSSGSSGSAGASGAGGAGDVYEGCWMHGMRHGPGTLMLSSGDLFEGHWERDAKHGPGTFFYMAKGCRYDGVWHEGTPRCGTYSEIQPAPPGAPGSIPNIELADLAGVLQDAEQEAAAAAGASLGLKASAAGSAAAGQVMSAAADAAQELMMPTPRDNSSPAGLHFDSLCSGSGSGCWQEQQQHVACTFTASGAAQAAAS